MSVWQRLMRMLGRDPRPPVEADMTVEDEMVVQRRRHLAALKDAREQVRRHYELADERLARRRG